MKSVFNRQSVTRALQFAAFLLVFALLFSFVSGILRGKQYTTTRVLYDEPRHSVDVLFMGSSHMLNAVAPMDLWAEHGIVSLNYAQNGQVLPVTYYALQEALRYQSPRLVVLDIYKVVQDSLIDSKASLHFTLDNMRFGLPKLRAIFDLLPAEDRAEYLVDLLAYHSRWSELTEADFRPQNTFEKGAESLFSTDNREGFAVLPPAETAPPVAVALEYLEKIIALCREEGIELLLIATPFTTPEEDDLNRQQVVNAMAEFAAERDLPFLNFMHELEAMDFSFATDMADMYHVNRGGMEKVTGYLGNYLAVHYDLPDHRSDSAYASWHTDYEDYKAYLRCKETP